jgi:hypothetical protein
MKFRDVPGVAETSRLRIQGFRELLIIKANNRGR